MGNKWRGWIIDESLSDASILSNIKILDIKVEENTSGSSKKVWKLYTVEVDGKEIERIAHLLEKEIKLGYYIHFTSLEELLIIFHGKSFKVDLESAGEDSGYGITIFTAKAKDKMLWKSAFEYGTKVGKVDARYIITVK